MKIAVLLTLIVSLLSWAQAKQNSNKAKERKPADSEGSVMMSNAQFEVASRYALDNSHPMRVLSIKKRTDCTSSEAAYFEVKLGSRNSQSGIESEENGSQILRVANKRVYQERLEMQPNPTAYVAEVYTGSHCK